MLETMLGEVQRFHGEVTGMRIPERPEKLMGSAFQNRARHLREELDEFLTAADASEQADALLDIAYVALGGLLNMGVCPGPVFQEVQRANLDKRPGGTDPVKSCVKPEGWNAPDLELMLSIDQDDLAIIKALRDGSAVVQPVRPAPQEEPRSVFPPFNVHAPMMTIFTRKPVRQRRRLLVVGHARHGKDTVCEILRDHYGYKFTSSSWFCAERVMVPHFEKLHREWKLWGEDEAEPPRYAGVQACYDDRSSHRPEWYQGIRDFNRPDPTALGRAIWAENDVYCGLRHHSEFNALRNARVFDVCIWVDGSERRPPEAAGSMSLHPWMADYVLDNNGDLEDLHRGLESLMETIHGLP